MNHIKFYLDNSYDVYSADALNSVMRSDIEDKIEDDNWYHFRSDGDLQPLLDIMVKYNMTWEVVELNNDTILHGVRSS